MSVLAYVGCGSLRTAQNEASYDNIFSNALKMSDHFIMDFAFETDTVSLSINDIQVKVIWENISDRSLWLYPDGYMIIQFDPLTEPIQTDNPILATKKQKESIADKVFLGAQENCERTYTFNLTDLLKVFENKTIDTLRLIYMFPISAVDIEQLDISDIPLTEVLLSESTLKLTIVP